MKTRQVTYSILNHLSGYLQDLEKVGLLEEKEMIHLHDGVQVNGDDDICFTLHAFSFSLCNLTVHMHSASHILI